MGDRILVQRRGLNLCLLLLLVFGLAGLMPTPSARAAHPLSWGGVFRSRDLGLHWIDISRNMQALTVLSIAVDAPAIYVGSDVGLFVTHDDGENWARLEQGLPAAPVVYALAFASPASGKRLYAGTNTGLYLSDDGGKNWRAAGDPDTLGGILSLLIDAKDPNSIYAGGAQGVWHSSDGGLTWTVAGDNLPHAMVYRLLAVDQEQGSYLYAATSAGLFRCKPDTEKLQWEAITTGTEKPFYALAEYQGQIMAGGDDGLFNGAATAAWQETADPLMHDAQVLRLLAVSQGPGKPAVVYGGTGWGLYRSLDGGKTWTNPRDVNVRDVNIGTIVADPADPKTIYAGGSLISYPVVWKDVREPSPPMPVSNNPAAQSTGAQPTPVAQGISSTGLGRNISMNDLLLAGVTLLAFIVICVIGFVYLLRIYRRAT